MKIKIKKFFSVFMCFSLMFMLMGNIFISSAEACTIEEEKKFLEENLVCTTDDSSYQRKNFNEIVYSNNGTVVNSPISQEEVDKEIQNKRILNDIYFKKILTCEYDVRFEGCKKDSSYDGTENNIFFYRLWGNTALGTMKAIVNEGWDTSDYAIVATMNSYHDALSASGLAGLLDCPILLTKKDELSNQTKNIITSKKVKNVIIVGREAAVSDNVEKSIGKLGVNVKRVGGGTAISTANEIYKYGNELFKSGKIESGWGSDAIVATSGGFQDALSISPYAYAKKAPIFLAQGKSNDRVLRDKEAKLINSNPSFTRTIICGGGQAVNANTEKKLKTAEVKRLGGGTAYGTSRLIAEFCISQGMSAKHMGVATGTSYYDALCAGTFLGKQNSVLLLTAKGNNGKSLTKFMNAHRKDIVPPVYRYTYFDTLDEDKPEVNQKIEELKNSEYKYESAYIGNVYNEEGYFYGDKKYAMVPTEYTVNYIFGGEKALPSEQMTGFGYWKEARYEDHVFYQARFCTYCRKMVLYNEEENSCIYSDGEYIYGTYDDELSMNSDFHDRKYGASTVDIVDEIYLDHALCYYYHE